MNNSVVVNGGLQEKNSRTDDVKNLLSNALSLLDSGIDAAIDKSKNIYGDINGEKMFNFTKGIKLFGMDFALNYDKSKSVEENIAHYSGNFLATAVVGSAVAFAGAGIVSSAVIAMGILEGLKALGFELGDYTEIAYKIAKEYANEIMNDEEVKLFSPTKDYKQKLYTDFATALKYFNEDGSVNFAKYLADMLNISLYDPIALDLNANGKIDTLSLENGVFFDHNGDDIAFKSSWISSADGILARDINGDKEINSGAELFGNFTRLKNGELAKNGAGEITLSVGVKISA
ncbi:MAG: hypothetical protein MR658_06195 [Campylobacter sp.]|uniref:hypothetical protein n=1 Tax=Campylobacter sp. TaxID=205 RepID=UPI002AA6C8EA|nr:hypothetical protein [Campylobacter sp.]MCI6178399.1 hypothetical protein [Campylobacter sp.]